MKELITSIKGFVSYSLVRTADGGFSVSVYQDKAGADESMKKAREWIGQNASATGVSAPTTSEGSVMQHNGYYASIEEPWLVCSKSKKQHDTMLFAAQAAQVLAEANMMVVPGIANQYAESSFAA